MSFKIKRADAVKSAEAIVTAAKSAGGSLTEEQQTQLDGLVTEIKSLDEQIAQAERGDELLNSFAALSATESKSAESSNVETREAATPGEAFVKAAGSTGLAELRSRGGYAIAAEVKAPGVHTTTGLPTEFLQDVDQNVRVPFRRAPIIADLFSQGTMSGTSIKYFIEGLAVDGAFTTVAQGAQKPQIQMPNPTSRVDSLSKIAAWYDISDEMVEDAPFIQSSINSRGLYLLSMFEEAQLLSGDGVGSNLAGLLGRSGVQVQAAPAKMAGNADAIFTASQLIPTATGLAADAVLINPVDYQVLRLAKDTTGDYYGGGYFYGGDFGPESIVRQPPLWGLNTIVTPAVAAGTFVVGAFKAGGTVFRKGGVRVEATNSDQGKFTSNIITIRIEERLALQVSLPSAFVKGTFSATP